MGWGSGGKKSGKLAKRRAGEMVEEERGSGGGRRGHNTITCGAELALDLPAKGTGERAEPVGGKIEYESLMRAISAPLPRPSATRFLRRLELSRLPILPVSLFISWPRCLLRRIRFRSLISRGRCRDEADRNGHFERDWDVEDQHEIREIVGKSEGLNVSN